LEGKGEEGLEKRKEQVKEIDDIGKRGLWGIYFSSKYKTLLIWGTKKLYWRRVVGGFGRVFMNCLNLIYVVIIFLKL
jgi:hypothetical protein